MGDVFLLYRRSLSRTGAAFSTSEVDVYQTDRPWANCSGMCHMQAKPPRHIPVNIFIRLGTQTS